MLYTFLKSVLFKQSDSVALTYSLMISVQNFFVEVILQIKPTVSLWLYFLMSAWYTQNRA